MGVKLGNAIINLYDVNIKHVRPV